jgi:hypothetical protein
MRLFNPLAVAFAVDAVISVTDFFIGSPWTDEGDSAQEIRIDH